MLWREPLVHLLVIVVISLLATVVLFKWLHSQAFVKKKEKESGLTVVLTGGAAAAVVFGVLLFMADKQLSDRFYKPPPSAPNPLWKVSGRVKLPDGSTTNQGVLFTVDPPSQTMTPDGRFLVEAVPVLPGLTTRINVNKSGYDPYPIVLTKANIQPDTTADDPNAYALRSDVVLVKSGQPTSPPGPGDAYNPDVGESPTPVGTR